MSPPLRYLSTTLALVTVGLGYALLQGRSGRPAPRLPAQSEAVARPAPRPRALPTAREILNHGPALPLAVDQVARLEALDREWRRESAGLTAALEAVAEEFSRFMKDAQSTRGVSIQEIHDRSADFRELSAGLRERRWLHGEAAARVLTESQREKLAGQTPPRTSGGGR